MPSETKPKPNTDLADRAYGAIESRVASFRRAVATAEQEVHADLVRRTGVQSFKGEQALIELGPFATGRIDPDRFAMLLGVAEEQLTPESMDVLGRADAILTGFAESSNHRVAVEAGGDLRDAVKHALAHFGQAFGAGRAVELARAGMFDLTEHGYLLAPLAFRLWNRAERQLAPPLVIDVRGEDCLPAGLGEFLDGMVTLILVASGPTTPAPLSRLVTPGTFVMQTASVEDLARVVATEHPAVVLLFDEDRPEQAHFVHDPDAGDTTRARLTVERMPTDAEVGRGRRAPVWLEELVHLRTLAEGPTNVDLGPAPGVSESGVSDDGMVRADGDGGAPAAVPADRLAAWLLAQTDISGL
jgi:hypothetical protein